MMPSKNHRVEDKILFPLEEPQKSSGKQYFCFKLISYSRVVNHDTFKEPSITDLKLRFFIPLSYSYSSTRLNFYVST